MHQQNVFFRKKKFINNWIFNWSNCFKYVNISKLYQYHINAIIICSLLLVNNMIGNGIGFLYFSGGHKVCLFHLIIVSIKSYNNSYNMFDRP